MLFATGFCGMYCSIHAIDTFLYNLFNNQVNQPSHIRMMSKNLIKAFPNTSVEPHLSFSYELLAYDLMYMFKKHSYETFLHA